MSTPLFHGDLVNTSRLIYTPSDFAKLSLWYLQEIGTLEATKPHTSNRDYLESYLFFVVISGAGILKYNGKTYPLQSGDCVFIDCRNTYAHSTSDDLWNLSWVHFDGPTATRVYQKYLERGGRATFIPNDLEAYQNCLQNIYKIATSSSYTRDMQINTGLCTLLSYLMADAWQPSATPIRGKRANFIDIRHYLEANYTKKITLETLGEHYHINKFYLTRIFKERFGTSIMDYLVSIRITAAKNMLRFTDKSTDEIGQACGIGDVYYFSRVFKKVEGVSPRDYRKMWR